MEHSDSSRQPDSDRLAIDAVHTGAGSITIADPDSAQIVDFAPVPWTPEEVEHYGRTGETPLARLHRENMVAQWSADD